MSAFAQAFITIILPSITYPVPNQWGGEYLIPKQLCVYMCACIQNNRSFYGSGKYGKKKGHLE